MISFKANFINNTTIDRLNCDGSYSKQKVAFVELDKTSAIDATCMDSLSKKWNNNSSFAEDIALDFISQKNLLEKHDYRTELDEKRFFALTRQKSNYMTLNPSKIIAIAEMTKEFDNPYDYLDLLQVKPCLKKKNSNKPRIVKNIGKNFVREILATYENKTIVVEPLWSAIGFYEKLGFKFCKDHLSGLFTNKTMAYIRKVKPGSL